MYSIEAKSGLKFLLIDDDSSELIFFEEALHTQPLAHVIHYEPDPVSALDFLAHTIPDIILLDIRMPSINGLDALIEIRNRQELDLIPVFMISGSVIESEYKLALERGALDLLAKPVMPDGYDQLVSDIIARFESFKASLHAKVA